MDKKQIIEWLNFLAANDPIFAAKVAYYRTNLQHVINALDDNMTLSNIIKDTEFSNSYDEGFHFREF